MSEFKFTGRREEFQSMIESIDANGSWSAVAHRGAIYRTAARVAVSWWQKSGKILVQGPDGPRRAMRAAISAALNGSSSPKIGGAPEPDAEVVGRSWRSF